LAIFINIPTANAKSVLLVAGSLFRPEPVIPKRISRLAPALEGFDFGSNSNKLPLLSPARRPVGDYFAFV
jgi:hypothetical protein